MVLISVRCLYYQSDQVTKRGKTKAGRQRYRCHNLGCAHQSFLLDPTYKGRLPAIKQQIIDEPERQRGAGYGTGVTDQYPHRAERVEKKGLRSHL